MIYTNLEEMLEETGIENKYALAMIIATRARQLSERRDSIIDGSSSEMCITKSIKEIEDQELDIVSRAEEVSSDAAILGQG